MPDGQVRGVDQRAVDTEAHAHLGVVGLDVDVGRA